MSEPTTLEELVQVFHDEFSLSSDVSETADPSGPCVFIPWGTDSRSQRYAEENAERIRDTGRYGVLWVGQHPTTQQWGIAVGLGKPKMPPLPCTFIGLGASKGVYEGTLKVILRLKDLDRLLPGDVLYCPTTDPRWANAFERAGAVVTQTGSLLCHAAIVCREYRLPCVVNTKPRLSVALDGLRVRVDGKAGTMEVFAP